jgi:hypothetical protein
VIGAQHVKTQFSRGTLQVWQIKAADIRVNKFWPLCLFNQENLQNVTAYGVSVRTWLKKYLNVLGIAMKAFFIAHPITLFSLKQS